ncbi:MAG: hypothetical protein K6G10_01045 [Butyrivibrio sp.]|nr:hypothetical protein [Butyrivibrio sp.]
MGYIWVTFPKKWVTKHNLGDKTAMKTTLELTQVVSDYLDECYLRNKKPSYLSLSKAIGTTVGTIRNVNLGSYNGVPYSNKPSHNRVIDNCDFEIIQSVFREDLI